MSTVDESTTESKNSALQEQQKLRLEALLAEYNKLENQIQEFLREIHELSTYSLISTAGIATLVVTLLSTNNTALLASVLLALPIPFAAMFFSVIGNINEVTSMGQYVGKCIESNVNRIVQSSSVSMTVDDAMRWETRMYTEVEIAEKLLGAGLRTWGQAALVFVPLVGSLVAYYFVMVHAQLTMNSWWWALLSFDLFLLALALSSALLTMIRGQKRAN
jgi:hypothetical protein